MNIRRPTCNARRPASRRVKVHWMLVVFLAQFLGSKGLAADTNAVLDGWFAAQKNLRSWSADFIQTRTLKTLTQPLTAAGHVDFAVPDEFRWELGKPARTIAVGSGDEMFVIYPLLKRAERYPLGPNAPKQWRDTMSLLQAGFPRSRNEFEAQFQVLSLAETNDVWQLALRPRSRSARQMMPELRLSLATNDFSLVSTEMIFVDGSRMRNDFTNAVLNPALDPRLFNWQPPADFKVVEPLSR
jgi:outer membrane lipoprotein-sorting protein